MQLIKGQSLSRKKKKYIAGFLLFYVIDWTAENRRFHVTDTKNLDTCFHKQLFLNLWHRQNSSGQDTHGVCDHQDERSDCLHYLNQLTV